MALALLALEIAWLASPARELVPQRDSGVFLYVAWRWLDGAVPYRDVWDHKPPGVYAINAIGLLLGSGSRWGVWALQAASLVGAALVGYAVALRAFGPTGALVGNALWLLTLVVLRGGGNYTEEYAIPLQFLGLYALASILDERAPRRHAVLLGVTGTLAFLLKPSLVGVWVTGALWLIWLAWTTRRWRAAAAIGGLSLLGGGTVMASVAAYFLSQGALGEMVDAVLLYNAAYSRAEIGARIDAAWAGVMLTSIGGLGWLAFPAWFLAALRLLRPTPGNPSQSRTSPLVVVCVLGVPLELALAALPGRVYPHYFIPLGATLSLLAANALGRLRLTRAGATTLDAGGGTHSALALRRVLPPPRGAPSVALGVGVLGLALARLAADLRTGVPEFWREYAATRMAAVDLAVERTRPDEFVLVWGAEAQVNFLARRRAPTRFVYHYPLLTTGYVRPTHAAELLQDLRTRAPRIIIDASASTEFMPPLDATARAAWRAVHPGYEARPDLGPVFDHVRAAYRAIGPVGSEGWVVYEAAP